MGNRKKKIIDKNFQFRTVFSVTSIALGFFGIIILSTIIAMLATEDRITSEIKTLTSTIKKENMIFSKYLAYSRKTRTGPSNEATTNAMNDHNKYMIVIEDHTASLKKSTDTYFYLLVVTIVASIALGAVFYFFLVRLTHRISGPVYVMKREIQDMIDGKEPGFRSLRREDELKDMHEKLEELWNKIREE